MKRLAPLFLLAVARAVIVAPFALAAKDTLVRAHRLPGGGRDAGLRRAWGALRELVGGAGEKTRTA